MTKPSFQQFDSQYDFVTYWKFRHLGWNVHLLPTFDGLMRFLAASEPRPK